MCKVFNNIPSDTFIGEEDYLQKFINETIDVPQLNYNKICEDRIKIYDFGLNVSNIEGKFDSIQELKNWIAEYAKNANLSYRETIEIIKRAKYFCKNYPEAIRCRLLAHQLCDKIYKQNNKNHSNYNARNATLEFGKNYSYTTNKNYNNESQKDILLNADSFNHNTLLQFDGNLTTSAINYTCQRISNLRKKSYSYNEMYSTINEIFNELNKIDIQNYISPYGIYNIVSKKDLQEKVQQIKDYLTQTKQNLSNFQFSTGSDDLDTERLSKYEEKIKNPTSLCK